MAIKINEVHHHDNTRYVMVLAIYEETIQNSSVHLNLPFGVSPFAVATAAKQGIVVRLNTIKEIRPCQVIPVFCAIVTTSAAPSTPISPLNATNNAESVPMVAITFSFAIKPVTAATTNTQPNEPS